MSTFRCRSLARKAQRESAVKGMSLRFQLIFTTWPSALEKWFARRRKAHVPSSSRWRSGVQAAEGSGEDGPSRTDGDAGGRRGRATGVREGFCFFGRVDARGRACRRQARRGLLKVCPHAGVSWVWGDRPGVADGGGGRGRARAQAGDGRRGPLQGGPGSLVLWSSSGSVGSAATGWTPGGSSGQSGSHRSQ